MTPPSTPIAEVDEVMNNAFDELHAALCELRASIKDALTARIWWGIAVWQVFAAFEVCLIIFAVAYTLAGGK